jgi:hypothetical protein
MKPGRLLFAVMLALVLAVLLTSGYFTAYIALGEYIDWRGILEEGMPFASIERNYPQGWMTVFFQPAAAVESLWIGYPVNLTYSEVPGPSLAP